METGVSKQPHMPINPENVERTKAALAEMARHMQDRSRRAGEAAGKALQDIVDGIDNAFRP
jgi:hypothetical protein